MLLAVLELAAGAKRGAGTGASLGPELGDASAAALMRVETSKRSTCVVSGVRIDTYIIVGVSDGRGAALGRKPRLLGGRRTNTAHTIGTQPRDQVPTAPKPSQCQCPPADARSQKHMASLTTHMDSRPQSPQLHPHPLQLPAAAIGVGLSIGAFRGGRKAGLQFLAEHAHNPPRTVKGWYLYRKAKNNRVILGAIHQAGRDSLGLAAIAGLWLATEHIAASAGLADAKELVAGIAVSSALAATCPCTP